MKFVASQLVGKDENFIQYFEQISRILPPQTDLLPFIRLITIPIIKQRFDTSFFIHKLSAYHFLNFLKYAEDEKHIHELNDITMCGEFSRC